MLRIWFIGHNSPGHPDREIPLDDFIRETLPPAPPAGEQLELLRHWFLPPQHRETFRQSETAWGYDGAVKYLAKLLAHKRTPTYSLHFPEAIAHRSMLRIWFIGHNSPGHPDREIPLDDFIRETLPPAPPAGEQLRLF